MYSSVAARTAAVRAFVHVEVVLLHRIAISMLRSPAISGTGDSSFLTSPRRVWRGARYFAGDPEGCYVGQPWRGRAVAGGPVALGKAVPKLGKLKRA